MSDLQARERLGWSWVCLAPRHALSHSHVTHGELEYNSVLVSISPKDKHAEGDSEGGLSVGEGQLCPLLFHHKAGSGVCHDLPRG